MSQHLISKKSLKDIDTLVSKVLKGLDYPEPPLRLEYVRELLRLDLKFYSSTNPSIVDEFVSRMVVAGKQIAKRPMLLWQAIRDLDLKALFIPDGKRIFIDETQPKAKHRWNETHEIAHTIIPWHQDVMYGDTEQSLSPSHRAELEAEANYGAGQLLFLREKFISDSRDCATSIATIKMLANRYKNTITSTLWRHVEPATVPTIALITKHPIYDINAFLPQEMCKHTIYSPEFIKRFGATDGFCLLNSIAIYCSKYKRGPLGSGEVVIQDMSGDEHLFVFETFHNSYDAMSLGVYSRKLPKLFF